MPLCSVVWLPLEFPIRITAHIGLGIHWSKYVRMLQTKPRLVPQESTCLQRILKLVHFCLLIVCNGFELWPNHGKSPNLDWNSKASPGAEPVVRASSEYEHPTITGIQAHSQAGTSQNKATSLQQLNGRCFQPTKLRCRCVSRG